jgi:hypothetical protein
VQELAIINAWHEALNAGNLERLTALSAYDIEVGGPRGTGRGSALLSDWVERAAIRLEPVRMYQHAGGVVVEQWASWRSPESGMLSDPELVATAFTIESDRVQSVIRYPDLETALYEAGVEGSLEFPDSTS